MKYLILNGNPTMGKGSFNSCLESLSDQMTAAGHRAEVITLRDMKIAPCTGCFKCWTKTPGKCIIRDDADRIAEKYMDADMVILASPLVLGYFSALMKNTIDRSIPLMHPHLEEVHEEIHHKKRYETYPSLGIIIEKEEDTDPEDLEIAENLFRRMALNMRTDLKFITEIDKAVEEVLTWN